MLAILLLAIVQGFTEFLPISSSAHLIMVPYSLGWQDQGLEMSVALHAGTLVAVILYFWRDVWGMVRGFFQGARHGFRPSLLSPEGWLSLYLIVATIPVVLCGVVWKQVSTIRDPQVIAVITGLFGVLLYIADRCRSTRQGLQVLTLRDAVWIGVAQSLALIPGVSRSGICMTAARRLGFDRPTSARFAFLLSIPAILGAVTLTSYDAWRTGFVFSWAEMSVGVCISSLSGLFAIHGMLRWVQHHSFLPFMIYRVVLAVAILTLVK